MDGVVRPLDAFRAQFPALERIVYLDTATVAPGARPVVRALRQVLDEWERGECSSRAWDAAGLEARTQFARLVNAPAEAVALIGSASEGAAMIGASLPPGRVVVGEREFRSNLFPWLALEERGFRLTLVPATDGVVSTEALVRAIDQETVLVAVSAVQFAHGYRVRLEEVAARAHASGALLFVDATQAVGALAFDVQRLQPDALVAHGYKWLLCPRGAAWLYVAPHWLPRVRPLAPSWRSAADPYAHLSGGPYVLPADARKLDLSPAWFSWVGARAALALLLDLPLAQVEARCLELADYFRQEAQRLGAELVPTEEPSHVLGLVSDDPQRLQAALAAGGVLTSARDRYLRLGFHAFNNEADVEQALEALRGALR
ncbi:MAG: aminotransferase class V [Dehalococcoidia bacterium]|nr:MAG: aminotransferase class V [Dehalococcoidia bacterium]